MEPIFPPCCAGPGEFGDLSALADAQLVVPSNTVNVNKQFAENAKLFTTFQGNTKVRKNGMIASLSQEDAAGMGVVFASAPLPIRKVVTTPICTETEDKGKKNTKDDTHFLGKIQQEPRQGLRRFKIEIEWPWSKEEPKEELPKPVVCLPSPEALDGAHNRLVRGILQGMKRCGSLIEWDMGPSAVDAVLQEMKRVSRQALFHSPYARSVVEAHAYCDGLWDMVWEQQHAERWKTRLRWITGWEDETSHILGSLHYESPMWNVAMKMHSHEHRIGMSVVHRLFGGPVDVGGEVLLNFQEEGIGIGVGMRRQTVNKEGLQHVMTAAGNVLGEVVLSHYMDLSRHIQIAARYQVNINNRTSDVCGGVKVDLGPSRLGVRYSTSQGSAITLESKGWEEYLRIVCGVGYVPAEGRWKVGVDVNIE